MEFASETATVDRNQDFAAFYRQQRGAAVQLVWLLTHDEAACEDVVQDAFAAIYPRFAHLEKPAAYLRVALINGVRQRARSSDRELRRRVIAEASTPSAVEGPTGGLLDAIARLPLPQRTALVLRYWVDLPVDEIALVLGVRAGTARSLLSRATATLRKEIAK